MNLEGRVMIDLPSTAGAPVRVEFARPGDICAVLRGRTADEALALIPAVYSVCATAQAHAAVMALEQASGVAVSPRTQHARKGLTGMETLREHLLRIALDWPGFIDEPARGADVRSAMALVPRLTQALFDCPSAFSLGREARPDRIEAQNIIKKAEDLLVAEVFAEPLEDWLRRAAAGELAAWADQGATVAARLIANVMQRTSVRSREGLPLALSPPLADEIKEWLREQDQSRLPLTNAAQLIPETTLYSRRLSDPAVSALNGSELQARLIARLVELARLPGELRGMIAEEDDRVGPPLQSDGFGWSAIEAARGLLIHAAQLRDGPIVDYRVLPPTRWNFDAEGVAKRCLSKLDFTRGDDDAALLRQANLIVNAIDPCVGHEVRVH